MAPVFAAHPDANLALVAGRRKSSPVLVVDIDGPSGVEKARSLGVTSGDDCWVQRTGGGGWHVVYYAENGLDLRRRVKPQGVALDLLVDGYALIPPSITTTPYQWLPGHSPGDIPLADVCDPPSALLDWWREVQETAPVASGPGPVGQGKVWELIKGTIPAGGRNDDLTRIVGWLRLYHPPAVVEALLLVINDARCSPPLDQDEVTAIVRSVCKYPQPGVNGHPRAVVPSFQREASDA